MMYLKLQGNNFFSVYTSDMQDVVAEEVGTFPIGEWSPWTPQGDGEVRSRPAGREWRYTKKSPVIGRWGNSRLTLVGGDFCDIIQNPNYYSSFQGHKGPGDYCNYCGAFNGPEGELRNGYDCFHCGSN